MNEIAASNIPANLGTNIAALTPKPRLTPGWQTTEFWMTILSQAGLVSAAAAGVLPAKYAAVAGVLSQVAYNLSRGLSKANAAR